MGSNLAASWWSAADAKRVWRALTGILDFGDRLDFVFLQLSSPDHEPAWKRSLRAYCRAQGLPFREPARGKTFLEWMESERQRGLAIEAREGDQRARSVYFGSLLGENRERFALARVNENRDRLVSALCGTLCLIGSGDFVRRVANGAPSIWAMRTRGFEIGGPPPPHTRTSAPEAAGGFEARRPAAAAPPSSSPASPTRAADVSLRGAPRPGASTPDLDVLLSAAPRDLEQAVELEKRLPGSREVTTRAADQTRLLDRARFVIPLLSPSYLDSEAWADLARHLDTDSEGTLRSRLIPVFLADTPVPGALRDMNPLRLRTAQERVRELPRLVRALRGEPESWSASEKLPLDEVPFAWSRPGAQELVETLVHIYPGWSRARLLAEHAGVSLHGVDASQGAFDFWRELVKAAASQGRLRSLIEQALKDPTIRVFHPRLRTLTGL